MKLNYAIWQNRYHVGSQFRQFGWKALAFCILLRLFSSVGWAQSMHIRLDDGRADSISLHDIRAITFDLLTGVGSDQPSHNATLVKAFLLKQNYPNPFNPTTSIEYELQKGGSVELRIYDIGGRLLRTLTHDHEEPGTHHFLWDGKDEEGRAFPSGTYFYQLRKDGLIESKKMMLLK